MVLERKIFKFYQLNKGYFVFISLWKKAWSFICPSHLIRIMLSARFSWNWLSVSGEKLTYDRLLKIVTGVSIYPMCIWWKYLYIAHASIYFKFMHHSLVVCVCVDVICVDNLKLMCSTDREIWFIVFSFILLCKRIR